MTTALGKELRKLRIDRNEKLHDMAKKIEVSASFISAIEVGKKSPPRYFEDKIITAYDLNAEHAGRLHKAADLSRDSFLLAPKTPLARDTAGLLARRLESLSDQDLINIQNILEGKK